MVKLYRTGAEFLRENLNIIRAHPLETTFFEDNAKSIERCDIANYAVRAEIDKEILLCVHVGDYPAVLFGSERCACDLAHTVAEKSLRLNRTLGPEDVSLAFWKEFERIAGGSHKINFSMDVMTCSCVAPCDVSDVVCVTDDDVEQVAELLISFAKETTHDNVDVNDIADRLRADGSCLCVKREGKIVSVATSQQESNGLCRIHGVYTLPNYRNRGLARQVVTALTERILQSGRKPYLHVDKTNPVSNHLYLSIGYTYGKTKLEIEYCNK